jgi:3-oxoadipate enol-lactonase
MAQLQAIFAWECFSRLPQINVPTLVIQGEDDQLVLAANAKLLAENIRGAKLIMLPNASHIFTTDQTQAALHAILEFLQNCPRPSLVTGGS